MLSGYLRHCGEDRFTGQLVVSSPQGQRWNLLFVGGRVVGDGQGSHPIRRWRRQLSQFCPELETDVQLKLSQQSPAGACDLESLLWDRGLQRSQINAVIEGSLSELFFDIAQHQAQLQEHSLGELTLLRQETTAGGRPSSDTLVKVEFLWVKAQQHWRDWQNAGLGSCSPNLSVMIRSPEQLKQEVSELTYRKLTSLMDGRRTLRDLAVKLGQDVRLLSQSLLSYVERGVMAFQEVADLGPGTQPITTITVSPLPESAQPGWRRVPTQQPQQLSPLIACIDDSPFICKALGEVVVKAGYRFVAIQDSLQAAPTLLKHKPNMIFLDLVMPIANGYEVCTQIRRMARFRETPIVILTGQDGIFDRVRAKLVGSTDFLSKPVEADKVLQMIERHLRVTADAPPRSVRSNPTSFTVGQVSP